MRTFGILASITGAIWLLIAFNFDTSVSTGSIYGPSRVENIGLIAQRQNHLYVAGLLTLIGVLLWVFGRNEQSEASKGGSADTDPGAYEVEPPMARDMNDDGYRLWLAEKYNIQRNQVFEKYVFQQTMYDTLEQALSIAHDIDEANAERNRTVRAAMSERDAYGLAPVIIVVLIGLAIVIAASL